jgi:hypothetical protein
MSVALVISVTGLLSAIAGLVGLFRKVQAVHVLVNSQLSKMISRVEQLTGVLQGAGLDVPPRIINGAKAPPAPETGERLAP